MATLPSKSPTSHVSSRQSSTQWGLMPPRVEGHATLRCPWARRALSRIPLTVPALTKKAVPAQTRALDELTSAHALGTRQARRRRPAGHRACADLRTCPGSADECAVPKPISFVFACYEAGFMPTPRTRCMARPRIVRPRLGQPASGSPPRWRPSCHQAGQRRTPLTHLP